MQRNVVFATQRLGQKRPSTPISANTPPQSQPFIAKGMRFGSCWGVVSKCLISAQQKPATGHGRDTGPLPEHIVITYLETEVDNQNSSWSNFADRRIIGKSFTGLHTLSGKPRSVLGEIT